MENLPDLYRAHIATLQAGYGRALESERSRRAPGARRRHPGGQPVRRPRVAVQADPDLRPLAAAGRAGVLAGGRSRASGRGCCAATSPASGTVRPRRAPDWVWAEIDAPRSRPSNWPAELPTGRIAFVGEDPARAEALGLSQAAVNPPALVAALDQLRAHKTRRTSVPAWRTRPGGRWPGTGTRSAASAERRPASSSSTSRTSRPRGQDDRRDAVQEHRRARRARGGAAPRRVRATKVSGDASLLVDAGATLQRLRQRHHAHVRARRRRAGEALRRADRAHGRAAAGAVPPRIRPGMPYEELHDQRAPRCSPRVLRDLGIAKGSATASSSIAASRARFSRTASATRSACRCHDVGMQAASAARRQPVPAQHVDDRGRPGLHDRAGHLLHRRAARPPARRTAGA